MTICYETILCFHFSDAVKDEEEEKQQETRESSHEKTSENIDVIDVDEGASKTSQIPATPIFHGGKNEGICDIFVTF